MKVTLLLSFTLAVLMTANVNGAAIEAPLDVITLDDLSQADRDYLAHLEQESARNKRSEDIFSFVKDKVTQGIKSKFSKIASASGHLSKGSSGKDYHHYESPPESYDEKKFDFWDLQKSILNTLVQAVKAIKGGLLTVKGYLIKGGGYIISAKGKMISAKGEAITSLGKHIASSALLSPRPSKHSHHTEPSGHSGPDLEYIPPSSSGFSGPSGHEIEFHPGHHGPPHGYSDHKFPGLEAYKDHLPRGAHHGILILKKIPKGHKDKHNGNDGSHIPPDKHKPDFKPEESSDPSHSFFPDLKSIFFASSHKEHEEKPSAHSHSKHPDDEITQHDDKPTDHELSPPPHKLSYHHDSESSYHEPSSSHFDSPPSHHDTSPAHHSPPSNHYGTPNGHLSPSGTSFKAPIEIPENNFQGYLKDLYNNPHPTGMLPSFNTHLPKLETYDPLKLPDTNPTSLTAGLSDTFPQKLPQVLGGLEHFPSYPVELSNNFGTSHNIDYYYHNYHDPGSYY